MKRIILSSLVILGLVGLIAGATVAYFSDTATIYGSTFSTSTMVLKIDSNPLQETYTWSDGFPCPTDYYVAGLYPGYPNGGEHNWQVLDLKNVGTVDGYVTIQLNKTSGSDLLADNLIFTVLFDDDNTGDFVQKARGTLTQFQGNTYTLGVITDTTLGDEGDLVGPMASVKIVWEVPTTALNDIQGKTLTIDTVFGLEQVR